MMGRRAAAWWTACLLLLLASCGGDPPAEEDQGPSQPQSKERLQAQAYMSQLKDILHGLRALQDEIGMVVTADTVRAEVIIPLVRERFRPRLMELRRSARKLKPAEPCAQVQQRLLAYLDQRISTCDLLLRGASEQRPALFEEFGRLQIEEERLGRELAAEVRQLRQQGY